MKALLTLVFFVSCLACSAQTSFLEAAASRLETALVKKDTNTLKQLLHPKLTYGHSNGWVETKNDVIKDLASGKLVYRKISSTKPEWIVTDNMGTLRTVTDIDYTMDGKEGSLHMHVAQVWVKTNKGWQLFARQSTKL